MAEENEQVEAKPTMFRCPYCGQLSPVRMACGGSFTDRDHPSSVLMVPVETATPETNQWTTSHRTEAEIREWVTDRRDHEYRNRPAPEHSNTVASGMALGAVETLDALTRYLNGDDDA